MVWTVRRNRHLKNKYGKNPEFVLYETNSDSLVRGTSDRVLNVREDITPISLTMNSLPEGNTLECRLEESYFIKSNPDVDETIEDLRSKVFILVQKIKENRRRNVKKTLIVGRIVSCRKTHASGQDILTIVLNDSVFYHAAPISLPKYLNYNLGQWMYSFNAGWFMDRRLENGTFDSFVHYYRKHPMLEDESGNPLSEIDSDLINSTALIGDYSAVNQPFVQVFSDLCARANLIPLLRYKNNNMGMILIGKQRGIGERELVYRTVGKGIVTDKIVENVLSHSGTETFFDTTKTIGVGSPVRTIEVLNLTKGFTTVAENKVRQNRNLNKKPGPYYKVGRFYKLPHPVYPTSPIKNGESEDEKSSEPRLAYKNTTTNEWVLYTGEWDFIPISDDNKKNLLDDPTSETNSENQLVRAIWIKDPITYAKPGAETSAITFPDVRLESTKIGEPFEVEVENEKYSPFEKIQVLEDSTAVKNIHESHFELDEEDRQKVFVSTDGDGFERDDTTLLKNRAQTLLEQNSGSKHNENIELIQIDTTWEIGDKIVSGLDSEKNTIYEDVEFVVEGIQHKFDGNPSTVLTLSDLLSKKRGGSK